MYETIMNGTLAGATYLGSMVATVGLMSAVGIAGVWIMERTPGCNPYAVFPCCRPSKEDVPGG